MQHKFSHSAPYVSREKEKLNFGKLTIPGPTEFLKRVREEKVKARSQKKKDRLNKETEVARKCMTESQNRKTTYRCKTKTIHEKRRPWKSARKWRGSGREASGATAPLLPIPAGEETPPVYSGSPQPHENIPTFYPPLPITPTQTRSKTTGVGDWSKTLGMTLSSAPQITNLASGDFYPRLM